jgi:hypothetical protein
MSNIFKINSRFAALVEDMNVNNKPDVYNKKEKDTKMENERPTDTKFNSFKRDDRPRYEDRRNSFCDPKKETERRSREEQKRKEDEIEKKKKATEEALSDKNFPELYVTNKVDDVTEIKCKSFLDKVKEQRVEPVETIVEPYIKPGYVVISRDKNTNNIIYKFGEKLKNYYDYDYSPNEVFDSLVELYERRKEKYIELWGEYEYDKVFKFQNYDYDYFDRLDQEYEDELERQNELEIQRYISSDEDY